MGLHLHIWAPSHRPWMCEWTEMNEEQVCNNSVHLANIGQFLVTPVFGTDGQLPRVLWKLPQG